MGIHQRCTADFAYTIESVEIAWLPNHVAAKLTRMIHRAVAGTVTDINVFHIAGERWGATEREAVQAIEADVQLWIRGQTVNRLQGIA